MRHREIGPDGTWEIGTRLPTSRPGSSPFWLPPLFPPFSPPPPPFPPPWLPPFPPPSGQSAPGSVVSPVSTILTAERSTD
ncbi:hypothetical protein EEB13_14460 [Rhodococcus sp. WS3]|nr:hypothetical protein EEB13_14460 [Rhodococcus sp. WS3]